MKNYLLLASVFLFNIAIAQVGINTTTPVATLDVQGNAIDINKTDGLIAPRITLAQLKAKINYGAAQKGTLLYVTDASGTTSTSTAQITNVGYYYFDGILWQSWALKSGQAIFTATLGTGSGGATNATIAANNFNTVPLPLVIKNIGGGIWNATNYTYTVATKGTYLIKSTIRLTDASASRNIFQAVGTSNLDIPDGIWQTNPTPTLGGRWTMLYTRIAYFNAGDALRLYIYSEGTPAALSDASLNISLLSQN